MLNPEVNFKPTLDMIRQFEGYISQFPQLEIQTKHYFADGLYAREIYIPAGSILVGKLHKKEHINIISKGKIIIITEEGYSEVEAPFTIISPINTKKVVMSIEETIWTTIHLNPINTKDLDEIEDFLIESVPIIEVEKIFSKLRETQ